MRQHFLSKRGMQAAAKAGGRCATVVCAVADPGLYRVWHACNVAGTGHELNSSVTSSAPEDRMVADRSQLHDGVVDACNTCSLSAAVCPFSQLSLDELAEKLLIRGHLCHEDMLNLHR